MQKTFIENGKYALIVIITIFGIFSVFILINLLMRWNIYTSMKGFYKIGYLISGLFISGMAFTNLRKNEKSISYLALPASLPEKVISELLLTTIGFTILYTVTFYFFNSVFYFIKPVTFVNIANNDILKTIKYYLILQSVFLSGAVAFRRTPVFYTGFVLFIAGMILIIIVALFTRYFNGIISNAGLEYFSSKALNDLSHFSTLKGKLLYEIPKFAFLYLLAPVFWIVTYLKLKEKEV
jgi:hypothetical protein